MNARAFQTLMVLTIGALLGYAAANSDWKPVSAALPTLQPAASLPADVAAAPQAACCSTSGGAELLLAQVDATSLAQAQNKQPSRPAAQGRKPNILMIMGDDIGWFNPSCYHQGIMGYQTPNIDRIAKEGARFTDWYGQQSCTAGRAAFITGQSPIRTGLTKVGLPGADIGLRAEDPSVADFLKNLGYATGQFGKNHLGDKDEFLPTAHGFDEFFGNLYHLNAEEEPENADYPKDPAFRKRFGPRGVLKCTADGKITDTGPLNRKRMETVDEEFLAAALDFIDRQHKANKPFFCYFNSTRMHIFTHLKQQSQGKTGLGLYPDGMVEHDGMIGQLLKKLDDLGIAENTIVVYTTDNGAEVMSWPDGGSTPFKGEKATNWEGGFRVPMCIRWPGVIKPGTIVNEICAHEDLIPTFAAAAGETDLVAKVKELRSRRQDLQGPFGRLQLNPVLQGRGERIAAEGVPLLERRRRADGDPLQPMEDRVQRAGKHGPQRLETRVHQSPRAEYLQPAVRSV
jgi:arylsulfatase